MSASAIEAFKKISYFQKLSDKVLVDLAKAANKRQLEREQVIYIEGENSDSIYFLESGWVKATRMTNEGREQALAFMQPGEIFGEVAAFTAEPYPATVTTLEPVVVWVIPTEYFLETIQRHPDLALTVIQQIGKRAMYFIGLIEDLALRSVEARLAHTLLRHAEARNGQLIVPRRPWTTFDEMSVRLGTVRDVLSRALKTLEAEGLLKVEKQAIILLDAEGLVKRGDL